MSAPRRIAVFPALVRKQTLAGCERRLFIIAVVGGLLPALYGGVLARRTWMMGFGLMVFVSLVAFFREMTKSDPHWREILVSTIDYDDQYLACARWDQQPKVRRYK